MSKLTEEQIKAKLSKMKWLLDRAEHKGPVRHMAMCYTTMRRYETYNWDLLPNEHTCPNCGKIFGGEKAKEREYESLFELTEDTVPDYSKRLRVDEIECNNLYEAHKKICDMGYDAVLEFSCTDCILNEGKWPVRFGFRMNPGDDYVVSYPDLYIRFPLHANEPTPVDKSKTFTAGCYSLAEVFLSDMKKKSCDDPITETYNAWRELYGRAIDENDKSWDITSGALRGILGLNID